ncbi:MAG: hypothetical protein ACR2NZ_09290 [Rubripirellula sp.]
MRHIQAIGLLLPLLAIGFHDTHQAAAEDVATELFDAIEAGEVTVRFIPADAKRANVLIRNQTDRVLHLQLPDAIAAVPVLAQFGQNGGQGAGQFGGGQQGGGGGTQGVGGGFDAGGRQGQGNQQGFGNGGGNQFQQGVGNGFMGVMRVAPQKQRKLVARTVCLEHGKPEPNPKIAYRMIPIDSFTDDTRVAELCRQLGRGALPQDVAQAAAWHLSNGLAWDKLAQLNRIESRYLGNIKFFGPRDIQAAKSFVEALEPSDSDSNSSAQISRREYADRR